MLVMDDFVVLGTKDRGACLKVGGGGQDSTGAISRRQAGFYPVLFYCPPKKGGHGTPGPPFPRSLLGTANVEIDISRPT